MPVLRATQAPGGAPRRVWAGGDCPRETSSRMLALCVLGSWLQTFRQAARPVPWGIRHPGDVIFLVASAPLPWAPLEGWALPSTEEKGRHLGAQPVTSRPGRGLGGPRPCSPLCGRVGPGSPGGGGLLRVCERQRERRGGRQRGRLSAGQASQGRSPGEPACRPPPPPAPRRGRAQCCALAPGNTTPLEYT